MDALEKMDDHPVHYPPKMDVLPKISRLIIYAAKCLKQQWQTVPSLLPDSYYIYAINGAESKNL